MRIRAAYDVPVARVASDSPALSRQAIGTVRRLPRNDQLAGAAAVLLAVTWPVFVFEGGQLAYLLAMMAAIACAALLGWSRSWLAMLFVVMLATLVGTEARGELGHGTSPWASVRLVDVALLAAAAGLVAGHVAEHGARAAIGAIVSRRGLHSLELSIVLGVTGWAVALWVADGARRDALVRTDVRLILLACGTYLLARVVVPRHWSRFAWGLLALAPLLALKAAAIYVTDFFTIGTFDRLQASFVEVPGKRVLLVGGDTLLILVPALAAAMALRTESPRTRALCALTAACAVGAVFLSGTRTSLLIVVGMVLAVFAVPLLQRSIRVTPRAAIAVIVTVVACAAGTVASGLAGRLTQSDKPHIGINARTDEVRWVTELPRRELVIGQGLGGSFISRNASGMPVTSGWSHVLPVWIVLKVGLLGLLALVVALGLLARRAFESIRVQRYGPALIGAQLVGGLILMSMTIGRLAQPEGAIFVAVAAVLLNRPVGRNEPSCA